MNPRNQKKCFKRHVYLIKFYYLICREIAFWCVLNKKWYQIGIVLEGTYRFLGRKRKYCGAPMDRYTPTVNHKIYRAFHNLSDYFIGAQRQEVFMPPRQRVRGHINLPLSVHSSVRI